jgi:hypothetical protein
VAVLVYVVMFTITADTILSGRNIVLSGPLHSVVTFTGTSTAGFNSTVQVRLEDLEPAIIIPAGGVTVTAVGAGTEEIITVNIVLQLCRLYHVGTDTE